MEFNRDGRFEVTHMCNSALRHTVHLQKCTCTCREWDLTGIPCPHTICAIYNIKGEPTNYVATWYRRSTYLKAYKYSMQPMKGKILWADSGMPRLEPPRVRKLPGRPKLSRRKDKDEIKKVGKMSRKGRTMTCGNCRNKGHNTRGCPSAKDTEVIKYYCAINIFFGP